MLLVAAGLVQAASVPVTPRTAIVVARDAAPDERDAARLLQEYLRKAFGARTGFDIAEAAPTAPSRIVVGGIAEGVYRDGFLIETGGGGIRIRGGSPAGVYHGAAWFLDRFAQVRFYMPGDLFTHVPARPPRIAVPEGIVRDEPYVRNSMMSGVGGFGGRGDVSDSPRGGEREWLRRNAVYRKEAAAFTHQHSMFDRFPPAVFAARFPEIYPVLKGQRYIPVDAKDQQWQPCLAEPKLVDAAEESALDFFRRFPERRMISFSVQDSHRHCECDRCRTALAKAGGNKARAFSDQNAVFLNALAARLEKSMPGRTIVYIAYSEVREVPSVKLHPSILPVVVFTIGDSLIDKRFEPGEGILDTWGAAVSQLGNHDWGQGKMYLIPRIYTGLTARLLSDARRRGLIWGYQHFEAYPNWGLDGLKLWVTARLWWNPDAETAALWKQAASDLFPSSAAEMARYFGDLEKLWILMDNDAERKLRKWSNQFDLKSAEQKELAAGCRRLLDRAAAAARTGRERDRVALLSKSYRLTEYLFEFANAPRVDRARVEEARRYARDVVGADPMAMFDGGDPETLMKDVDAALAAITKGKLD